MEELKWKDDSDWDQIIAQSSFFLASFPGLPSIQFLIACSMQKQRDSGKVWERG